MRCVMTLVCVSVTMAGEMGAVMVMAAEHTARAGGVRRMTGVPRMVSQPSQGHDHEARRTERQTKRIHIHKVTACKILRPWSVQIVPERVGILYPLCKRMTQTATTQPIHHMVWYGEQVVARLMVCADGDVLSMTRRGE
jgi:hypothetical protein